MPAWALPLQLSSLEASGFARALGSSSRGGRATPPFVELPPAVRSTVSEPALPRAAPTEVMGELRAARVFDTFGDYVAPDDVACWSKEDVANWVHGIGYPQYVECFRGNGFNGAGGTSFSRDAPLWGSGAA